MSNPMNNDGDGTSSSHRLRRALAAMVTSGGIATASALCESAGVSRNALYRYHPDVLHELHKLQHQRHREPGPTKRALQQLRSDNDALKLQVAQLAALVDHYFAAWQETSALLKRREQQLADIRKSVKPNVVLVRKDG